MYFSFASPEFTNSTAHIPYGSGAYLSTFQRNGVIAMAVAGLISCSFVSLLLLYIIISAVLFWRQQKPDSSAPFIRKQVVVFVVCLLVADLIQSISGVLQWKWASQGSIYHNAACTVQAITLTLGDLASTVWSSVIAAHTFSSIALGKKWSRNVIWATVASGWIIVIILTSIGPLALQASSKGPFYGIAGDWCFITSNYAIERLVIHYVPLFIAAVLITVLYGLVFLVLKGHVNFTSEHAEFCPLRLDDATLPERVAIAKRMLWYPIAYLTCTAPIAVIRLLNLTDDKIPESVWIFGVFVLFLLGAVDSVIYATTRKLVKPIRFSMPLRGRLHSDACSPYTQEPPTTSSRRLGVGNGVPAAVNNIPDMVECGLHGREITQKSASQKSASLRSASRKSASQKSASQKSAPQKSAPQKSAPQKPACPTDRHELTPCVSAIHVTFERYQEVR